MTDTFRALCAELTEKLDELNCLYKVPSQSALIERALDALAEADEPAVPDGREPAEEWQTGLPSSPGFYYVRDLLDESIGGDNRPVYVNPKHFVWGFWEQDDPEWIGLDSDITPENIQWKPVAPPLAPPAAVTGQLSNEAMLAANPDTARVARDYYIRGMEDAYRSVKDIVEVRPMPPIVIERPPTPPADEGALPEDYIDPEHSGDDRALLEVYYSACQAEGGTADEVTLRGLRAVLAHLGNPSPAPPATPISDDANV